MNGRIKNICLFMACSVMPMIMSAQEPKELLLWPKGAPGSEGKGGMEKVRIAESGDHVVSNIHHPSITPFLPDPDKATGAAVIIAPGGGHRELWIDHEGYNIAHFLQEQGIAAFVLKYRLAKDTGSLYKVQVHALADIQRAIRMVRSRAQEWKIDTGKVGVIGFSAGGELAALSAMYADRPVRLSDDELDKQDCRPDFQALIYPGNSAAFTVKAGMPPVFIVCGYNDNPDISEGMATLYLKYKQLKIPADLHIYSGVGHGFGIRKSNTGEVTMWPMAFVHWLSDRSFSNHH